MKVLILDISIQNSGNRTRSTYIVNALKDACKVHFVRWVRSNNSLVKHKECDEHGVVTHYVKLFRSLNRINIFKNPIWNQAVSRSVIRKIILEENIDLVIWPNNWYQIGYPPRNLGVPVILDYFDLLTKKQEKRYLSSCKGAICASNGLNTRIRKFTRYSWFIPTPIDVGMFTNSDGTEIRKKYNLVSHKVISLIGLTAASSLYFINAIDLLDCDVRCLLVGGGKEQEVMKSKVAECEHPERFIFTGPVPYSEIPAYFQASDVGMYPGDDTDYFNYAAPIKVLEYLASGKPVVTNALKELEIWNLPGIVMTRPEINAFKTALENVIHNLDRFSCSDFTGLKKFTLDTVKDDLIKKLRIVC